MEGTIKMYNWCLNAATNIIKSMVKLPVYSRVISSGMWNKCDWVTTNFHDKLIFLFLNSRLLILWNLVEFYCRTKKISYKLFLLTISIWNTSQKKKKEKKEITTHILELKRTGKTCNTYFFFLIHSSMKSIN